MHTDETGTIQDAAGPAQTDIDALPRLLDEFRSDLDALLAPDDGDPALTTLVNRMTSLEDAIRSLAPPPVPAPQISAQHASFARFGAMMGHVVSRLEAVTDGLIGDPEPSDIEVTLLADLLERLDRIEAKFDAREPAELVQLLGTLSDRIAGLPEPRDAALSATVMHQGLARLGTALSHGIARIELAAAGEDQSQAMLRLAQMESALGAMRQDVDARDRLIGNLLDLVSRLAGLNEDENTALRDQLPAAEVDRFVDPANAAGG